MLSNFAPNTVTLKIQRNSALITVIFNKLIHYCLAIVIVKVILLITVTLNSKKAQLDSILTPNSFQTKRFVLTMIWFFKRTAGTCVKINFANAEIRWQPVPAHCNLAADLPSVQQNTNARTELVAQQKVQLEFKNFSGSTVTQKRKKFIWQIEKNAKNRKNRPICFDSKMKFRMRKIKFGQIFWTFFVFLKKFCRSSLCPTKSRRDHLRSRNFSKVLVQRRFRGMHAI